MKTGLRSLATAAWLAMAIQPAPAAPLKVMAIGDSMTEEYRYEFIFSAPDKSPLIALPGDVNTMNWVEILDDRRNAYLDFGSYESSWPFGYSDWRQAGHEYNFGIPGSDTNRWMQVLHPDPSEWEEYLFDLSTRAEMRSRYANMDVIVIMLGGNDVNFKYGKLYNTTAGSAYATSFINNVINNLTELLDEIENYTTTVPIVLADVPDLGCTPDIIGDHPDPAKRANASAIIADLNAAVANLAASRGATLAPISNLTGRILSPDPLYIGAIEMIKDKDPQKENRPKYLFCWKGLHPSTNGQAIIANTLLEAINTATGSNTPPLPDREILADLMGLDPDQPYKDWAAVAGLTNLDMDADPDGDGIPNLGEYLLNLNPTQPDTIPAGSIQQVAGSPMLTLNFTPDPDAGRLADVIIQQSTDLNTWSTVPPSNLIETTPGTYQARLPLNNTQGFLRMEFHLNP